MTLTVERELSLSGGQRRRLPLLAGAAPVAGALLSWDATGYVHGLVAGEAFAGVCRVSVRKAFATDGEGQVDAVTGQFDLRSLAAIATIDATDVASATPIYASDDGTFTATATSNTHIGAVAGIDSDGRVQIAAATAEVAASVASPDDVGGIFGAKTIVVGKGGDDAAGAASPYAAEFLTINAAIIAAAAGDVVIVRPGTYVEAVELKTGVNLHGMIGARIAPAATGNCLSDVAVACDLAITGHFRLTPSGGGNGVRVSSGGTYLRVECETIDVAGVGHAIRVSNGGVVTVRAIKRIDAASGSNVFVEDGSLVDAWSPQFNNYGTEPVVGGVTGTVNLRAMYVLATAGSGRFAFPSGVLQLTADVDFMINVDTGIKLPLGSGGSVISVRCARFIATSMVVQITHGAQAVHIAASQEISAGRILVDTGSTGATRVSIKAPSITASEAGQEGVTLTHSAAARYDIDADVLRCGIANRIDNPASELHVNGRSMQSHAGSGGAGLNLQKTGRTFLRCAEFVGIAGAPEPIYMQETAELHILGGRIRGLDGDAGGHAILTSSAGPKIRLYPGTVLIAGDDVAAKSIMADNTPTVIAFGDIAANKAADGGVVVAVGSLLVDAAVV